MPVLVFCSFKVCKDINECDGPKNGGCVENSVCMNTPVSNETLRTILLCLSWTYSNVMATIIVVMFSLGLLPVWSM